MTSAAPSRVLSAGDPELARTLRVALSGVDAPDVVLAHTRHGLRTVVTGGTGPPPAAPTAPRAELRYELGSVTKTLTGLLLAELTQRGLVRRTDPVLARLPAALALSAPPDRHRDAATLLHLITHTAGLPRLPRDFWAQALPRLRTNPYAAYPRERLLEAFVRGSGPRRAPGSRWHYSNYGVALLGQALATATGTPYEQLLARWVLEPLGLRATGCAPRGPHADATGHGRDGRTALPPFDAGGFAASAGVRSTPEDLLRLLEAHLRPEENAPELGEALLAVREPMLHRGWRHRHTHTLTWFRHLTDRGPLYFHSGATMGQEAFLGFRPATGTALAALATRRYARSGALAPTAYRLLTEGA